MISENAYHLLFLFISGYCYFYDSGFLLIHSYYKITAPHAEEPTHSTRYGFYRYWFLLLTFWAAWYPAGSHRYSAVCNGQSLYSSQRICCQKSCQLFSQTLIKACQQNPTRMGYNVLALYCSGSSMHFDLQLARKACAGSRTPQNQAQQTVGRVFGSELAGAYRNTSNIMWRYINWRGKTNLTQDIKLKTQYFFKWFLYLQHAKAFRNIKERDQHNEKISKTFNNFGVKFNYFTAWKHLCKKKRQLREKESLIKVQAENRLLHNYLKKIKEISVIVGI